MASQHPGPYAERLTPRGLPPGFAPSHDPTPALRQLSEYARPHVLGMYICTFRKPFLKIVM